MSKHYISNNSFRQSFSLGKDEYSTEKGNVEKLSSKELEALKEEVLKDLQTALLLELSTIPPYLCAQYSIEPGTNEVPVEIIKSVVIEEMLHMVLVSNIMNALGGQPVLTTEEVVPKFPSFGLPACGPPEDRIMKQLRVGLTSFSQDTIRLFEKIEHPSGANQFENQFEVSGTSIGDFYEALKKKIARLSDDQFEEVGQIPKEYYYGAGGHIISIKNRADAIAAIDEIIEQGEGDGGFDWRNFRDYTFGDAIGEVAHYFRFKEIRFGRFYKKTDGIHRDSPNKGLPSGKKMDVDWTGFFPFKPNPSLEEYKTHAPDIYEKALDFSRTYMMLLKNLEEAFNGDPEKLKVGIPLMYHLRTKAVELMKIPYGEDGYTAGPTFEYVDIS